MSYKKTYNSNSNWKSYCRENLKLIQELQFLDWVFEKEFNFREFATRGQMNKENEGRFDFDELDNELFWNLFKFINNYFDYDSILFTRFEESRLNKQNRDESNR